jgi:hypothetical protein
VTGGPGRGRGPRSTGRRIVYYFSRGGLVAGLAHRVFGRGRPWNWCMGCLRRGWRPFPTRLHERLRSGAPVAGRGAVTSPEKGSSNGMVGIVPWSACVDGGERKWIPGMRAPYSQLVCTIIRTELRQNTTTPQLGFTGMLLWGFARTAIFFQFWKIKIVSFLSLSFYLLIKMPLVESKKIRSSKYPHHLF